MYSFLDLEPISCSIWGSNCCFLTCKQVSQETGQMAWYFRVSKSFSQFDMIHTLKGFSILNETETDIFLKVPCFLYYPVNVGNLISGSSSFSKPSLDIWNFLVQIMLKPRVQGLKHNLTSMGMRGIVR